MDTAAPEGDYEPAPTTAPVPPNPDPQSAGRTLRSSTVVMAALNAAAVAGGGALLALVFRHCRASRQVPVALVAAAAGVKIAAVAAAGAKQRSAARAIARADREKQHQAENAADGFDRGRLLRKISMRPMSPSTEAAAAELAPRLRLRNLRVVTIALGAANICLILLCLYLMGAVLEACSGDVKLPFSVVSVVAVLRLICILGAGFAQLATAETIIGNPTCGSPTSGAAMRQERRMRYRRWLWWARLGMGVTILQFISALYLMFVIVKDFSYDGNTKDCYIGPSVENRGRKRMIIAMYMVLAWLVAIVQCFTGSDVLRWRSFYATHDTAWKAHYLEVFDHGIREALCCMGRARYLSVLEEDEVSYVARLLGDLVAYRASGTGHLEFLAGLALLQKHKQPPKASSDLVEAPEAHIKEAASYHQFAEAAYTGPLLDFGRNPVLFPCAWLYRQGVLTPWTRNRRPVLEGDNWWRGHAAAFLKYVNLRPDVLRKGRVSQTKREAAYFAVVLHPLRSVIIAVRGTETPEDLLTDGLCRESPLTAEDLDGLINGNLSPELKARVRSSFPHYGHSGIIHSARELYMQLDGEPEGKDNYQSKNSGFLSSLLGDGQECHGYKVLIVGHSLGGAVAALLGIRLYARYPNLHVYCYGTLPCVDLVVAEACSDFVTSLIYNDEFSARLSINSILRLRADAIAALSDDSSADSAIICKLARRVLHVNKPNDTVENVNPFHSGVSKSDDSKLVYRKNLKYTVKGGVFLCAHAVSCVVNMPSNHPCSSTVSMTQSYKLSQDIKFRCRDVSDTRASALDAGGGESSQDHQEGSLFDCSGSETEKCNEITDRGILGEDICNYRSSNAGCSDGLTGLRFEDSVASFPNDMSPTTSMVETAEVYLPGLIIHIEPDQRSIFPLWSNWRMEEKKNGHRAFVAQRENFKNIVVSPFMFLDHLPWRCHYAMQKVLETRKAEGQLGDADILNGYHIV